MPDNKTLLQLAMTSTNPNAVLIELFKQLAKQVEEVKKQLEEKKDPDIKVEELAIKLATRLLDIQKGEPGKDGLTPTEEQLLSLILPNIPEPKQGAKGDTGNPGYTPIKGIDYFDGKQGEPGKNGSPDTPEQVRDKLETLKDEDRLDVSAIRGLEEKLKTLPGRPVTTIFGPGKTKILTIDLSSQLDGSTKTFNLGTHYGIVGVWGSSSPFIFRPTTDYTEVGQTIVFDAAIDASIALASGQSLLVQVLR